MLHFSALVCPGLVKSLGKGPSLALLVTLIINNGSKKTGMMVARAVGIALRSPAEEVTPCCATDPWLISSPPGTLRNARAAGLSGR